MSSVDIPRWVGPVVTPVLLILVIIALCFYFCYWKPRKQRKKHENDANKKVENDKQTVVKPCQVRYEDDTCYVYNTTDYSYGPFYYDFCTLPVSSGLSYCRQKEYQPRKLFYYTKSSAQRHVHKPCKLLKDQADKAKVVKCKVKCQKGHCLKCPDLPVIVEGISLIEEEENGNSENKKMECNNCSDQCPESAEVFIECEIQSNGSSGSSVVRIHDSGDDSGQEMDKEIVSDKQGINKL